GTTKGTVTFLGVLNSASTTRRSLTINAGSAAVSLKDVGNTNKLGNTSITAGTINLEGDIETFNGDISLAGAVIIKGGNRTLSSAGGAITLGTASPLAGTVNGDTAGTRDLTLNAGNGSITVNALVGNLRRLQDFTISDADDVNINNSITATTISITADGGTDGRGNLFFNNPTSVITGATTITSNATVNSDIDVSARFAGTVDIFGPDKTNSRLRATSNSNFTVTGTDVTDRSKGTLTKTQPGRPAVISFENIVDINLTGGTSSNVFTFKEWFNDATVNGVSGTSDTIVVDRSDATGPVDYVLGSSSLTINDPATSTLNTLNFSNIQASTLVGGPGADTFTLSNWTGKAKLVGNEDADKLIWSNASTTTSTLTATGFTAGSLQATFNSLEEATLTSSAGTFNVNGFQGAASLVGSSGATVNATYNADFTLNSTASAGGTINAGGNSITFSGTSTVRLNGGIKNNAFTLSGTAYTGVVTINGDRGNDVFNLGGAYTGVVVVNGDDGNDTFNLTGSYTTGGITVNGGQGNDSYNLTGSYAGTITLNGGEGNDTYNITLPASSPSLFVTVSDSGTSTRDTINATKTGSTALQRSPSTGASGKISYVASPTTSTFPRIDFSGIEIVNLL
ncbi:MAG: hypothetical protein KJS91_02350, partial [Planctomycetes bacterium]|nr:hypothetical protein [Planctomycetota bacterium]